MSNILAYPAIPEVSEADLLIISDISEDGNPTRTVSVQALVGGSTAPLGLTVNGTSGAATLIDNILNIPIYTGGGGGGGVTQIIGGTNVTVTPVGGTGIVTVNSTDQFTGTVTGVTGTLPITSSGGTTPAIGINNYTGADGTTAGTNGAVPAPAATDNVKFLKGDGTWAVPAGGGGSGSVTSVSASTAGDALDVAVTNATTTPDLAFTWAGTNNQYINGAGDLATLPATATTYNLDADQDGLNVDLRLTPSTGSADIVQFTAGSGITLTETGNNNITIAASGSGGLTSVGASSNYLTIANSPLTSNGVIQVNMPANGVPVGTYTNATVTVDQYGFVTNASSGSTIPSNIVETVTTTDGQFIDLTPNSPTSGAVAVTADLSATGTPSSTTFLRGDNTWATPSGGGGGTMSQWNVDDGGAGGFQVANNNTVTVNGSTKILVSTNVAAKSITTTHVDTARTDTTSTASPAAGATFTVVDSITQDATGHPTAVNVKTVTMPAGGGGGSVNSVDETTPGTSIGTPIVVDPTTGSVLVKSMAYDGTTNVGHVPTGGSATTFLRGDGTWVVPTAGSGLWATTTGNDIYNTNYNAANASVVIGKALASSDTDAALEISGRVSQVDLGNSTFFGFRSGLVDDLSSNNNTGFGYLTLSSNTSGGNNTAVGNYTLALANTATSNTAIGSRAMQSLTTGNNNTAIGTDALKDNQTSGPNTAVGVNALRDVTGSSNVGVGYRVMEIGTSCFNNTCMGDYSLKMTTTSARNAAFGNSALEFIEAGQGQNVAIGDNAGANYTGINNPLTQCEKSIFIGASTEAKANNSINEIVIGHDVIGNGSNTITLGNADNEETHLTGVVVLEGYTFSTLPTGPIVGMRTYITDGGTPTYGGNASGGGGNKLPVFYNGTNWIYA